MGLSASRTMPRSVNEQVYHNLWVFILEPEKARLEKIIEDISYRHVARGSETKAMLLDGKVILPASGGAADFAKPIHPDLEQDLRDVVTARDNFAGERQHIRNCLSFLLPPNATDQDIRDSFTDMIIHYLPPYSTLDRSREPAFNIADKPTKLIQWEKAVERLEYYVAMKLIDL